MMGLVFYIMMSGKLSDWMVLEFQLEDHVIGYIEICSLVKSAGNSLVLEHDCRIAMDDSLCQYTNLVANQLFNVYHCNRVTLLVVGMN